MKRNKHQNTFIYYLCGHSPVYLLVDGPSKNFFLVSFHFLAFLSFFCVPPRRRTKPALYTLKRHLKLAIKKEEPELASEGSPKGAEGERIPLAADKTTATNPETCAKSEVKSENGLLDPSSSDAQLRALLNLGEIKLPSKETIEEYLNFRVEGSESYQIVELVIEDPGIDESSLKEDEELKAVIIDEIISEGCDREHKGVIERVFPLNHTTR